MKCPACGKQIGDNTRCPHGECEYGWLPGNYEGRIIYCVACDEDKPSFIRWGGDDYCEECMDAME